MLESPTQRFKRVGFQVVKEHVRAHGDVARRERDGSAVKQLGAAHAAFTGHRNSSTSSGYACRVHEKGAQTGHETLCGAQVGSTLAAAIEDL